MSIDLKRKLWMGITVELALIFAGLAALYLYYLIMAIAKPGSETAVEFYYKFVPMFLGGSQATLLAMAIRSWQYTRKIESSVGQPLSIWHDKQWLAFVAFFAFFTILNLYFFKLDYFSQETISHRIMWVSTAFVFLYTYFTVVAVLPKSVADENVEEPDESAVT